MGETTLETACFAATAAFESQSSASETADFEDCSNPDYMYDSIPPPDRQIQGGCNFQSDPPTSSAKLGPRRHDLDLLGAIRVHSSAALEVSLVFTACARGGRLAQLRIVRAGCPALHIRLRPAMPYYLHAACSAHYSWLH